MEPDITTALARRHRIAKAAHGVFLRYGYARTKMTDIAEAAGLSRPTLYLSFPDKETVFRAVVEMIVSAKLATIREGVARLRDVEAKLSLACEVWGVDGVELMLANPNAKDVFDMSFAPVRDGYMEFQKVLLGILSEPLAQSSLSVPAFELARVILYGIKGFKEIARDEADMRLMVRALITTVSAALRQSQAISEPRTKARVVNRPLKSRSVRSRAKRA
jgi:AcrR family transcriptional regulator